ncbi:MAG: hypothetical protein ACR2L6_10500 [Gemmatimonadaceae bacterium]
MHATTSARAALAAALLVTAATACGKKDAPPADTVSVAPSAATPARVSDIQLGKRVGADKRIVEPTTTFGTRDTIYVSVTTEGAAMNARLTATWLYNGTQGVEESDEVISSSGGTHVSEFHISKATPWPAGSYKVDVQLNGVSAGAREFRVQ